MADKQSPGESQHLEFTDLGQGFSRTSPNKPPRINLKTALVFISLCLVAAAAMMTLVGTGAYSRNITATIGGSEIAVWLNQCVAITTCILASPIAQASDYWGRKWFIVVTTFLGCAGCLIVSRATSMAMAIAGQIIGSISFAAQPLMFAVLSEIMPRKQRAAAQAALNAASGVGGIFALLVGSILVEQSSEGWRLYFYIDAAVLGLSAIACTLFYNPPARPLQSLHSHRESLKQLDWVGSLLLALGFILLSVALTWVNNPYPADDAHCLAPLILGIVLILALGVHQGRIKPDGLFHHRLFTNRTFAISALCMFGEGVTFFAANNYYIFECSILYDTNTFRLSLRYSLFFIMTGISAVAVAYYCARQRTIRGPIVLAFISFAVFHVCMATATASSNNAVWGYPIILGLGMGLALTCIVTVAQLSTPPDLIAIATGLLFALRSLGGSVALAVYTAIFNSVLHNHMASEVAAAVVPLGFDPRHMAELLGALQSNNVSLAMQVPTATPDIVSAALLGSQLAYLAAFRSSWIAAAVFAAATALAACFIVNPENAFTADVDAPLAHESQSSEASASRV